MGIRSLLNEKQVGTDSQACPSLHVHRHSPQSNLELVSNFVSEPCLDQAGVYLLWRFQGLVSPVSILMEAVSIFK